MSRLKIALIGYGRMGRIIERIALERGHEITCRIDAGDEHLFSSREFAKSDVAIEFTVPQAAVGNILKAFAAGVPVVSGTTGWNASLPEIKALCQRGDGTLFHASNFSIGVNVFMALNRYLARIMDSLPQYAPSMKEIHHIHKLDHPSGTAITLAEEIVESTDRIKGWNEPTPSAEPMPDILPVDHERIGETPGTHIINWDSPVDTITITHCAKSREGFALGAVMAAEWLKDKKGFFTMSDMLQLPSC